MVETSVSVSVLILFITVCFFGSVLTTLYGGTEEVTQLCEITGNVFTQLCKLKVKWLRSKER
jgi:hypothetical protein